MPIVVHRAETGMPRNRSAIFRFLPQEGKMMRRFRGFTLIELLVVIAIIAILAAILFPVFASAREKARQTTCMAQAKQLGIASQMYLQDYDEIWVMESYGVSSPDVHSHSWGQGNAL